MQTLRHNAPGFAKKLLRLTQRRAFDPGIDAQVAEILAAVRRRGDAALAEFARKFDRVNLRPAEFAVSDADWRAAGRQVPAAMRRAVQTACRQIRRFSAARRPRRWSFTPRPGVTLGEQFMPLERVGVYVPGGTAPLISTVLHTVTLARVAGVREIVVATPPGPNGAIHPALLYAARHAGATEVYRLGGVYAVAALAYGTESVRKVEKIVGPGNAYVTAAKRQVYGDVALDLVAGPSEIMVIADDTANPAFIAADLLSQAEHGSGCEQAVLVTTAADLPAAVRAELNTQSRRLGRSDAVAKVLKAGVFLVHVASLDQAVEIASAYAPEHLEIMTRDPARLARRVTAAGAIFLGPWTPEPVGDFVAGPSHVLPTGGSARFFSGLTVDQFFRRTSLVRYSAAALRRELPYIEAFAAAEGLDAHGRSATVRHQDV